MLHMFKQSSNTQPNHASMTKQSHMFSLLNANSGNKGLPLQSHMASCEAIEHRENSWSRRRLLLDVGATDAHGKATRRLMACCSGVITSQHPHSLSF